jgi:hypothetical protein
MKKMKAFKIVPILFILAFTSCKSFNLNGSKSGDLVIIDKDTFVVNVDTFRVISTNRINPRNVLEEVSPQFENLTDKGKIFFLPRAMPIGDTILTRTLIKVK